MCTTVCSVTVHLALAVLLVSPLHCMCDEIEDVCPGSRTALIANRTEGVNPRYDGGTVEGWFSLAREFVNAVKGENLPYDVIERGIEDGGLPCEVGTRSKEECRNHTSSSPSFDVGETFSNFLEWWTPILIVSCLGVGVGVGFLVAGCVTLVCRCCGRCGGDYAQRQSHDYAMCSLSLLLLLCTLGLLSGVVLTLYSSQQSYDSLDSVHVAVNTAVDYAVEFAEKLINDGITLFCLVVDIVRMSLEELEGLGSVLKVVLDDISSDVDRFLTLLEQNAKAINASGATLEKVASSSLRLNTRHRHVEEALVGVVDLATSLLEECENRSADCQGLPHPSIFVLVANYSTAVDVDGDVSDEVNRTLSEVDFEEEAKQGRGNFSEEVHMIDRNITMHINESEMELERLNDTVIEQKENITNSTREVIEREVAECSELSSILEGMDDGVVELNAGYIQHCIIDQGFDQIEQYDKYRYWFGVCVCCLSMVVLVLVLLGMVLGVVGWRPKRQPYDRTSVSHCGGRFLLIAVGVAFVFGCLVMVMAAVGFFFGSNAQKVCQSLAGPEYEGFTRVVDSEEVWGGSLLGTVVFGDPQETLALSQLLRNCEDDYALYKAMNLSFLFEIRSDIINFTEVTETLSEEIFAAAESVQLTSESFFSSTALQGLISLNNLIGSINIESIQAQLNESKTVLGFSPEQVVHNLTVYRNSTTDQATRDQVDQLISDVESVSNMAEELESQARLLLHNVNTLHTVVTTTSELIDQATEIISFITGDGLALLLNQTSTETFTTIAGHIDDFIQDLANGLDTSIGRCRPLWGIYTELYNSVCLEVVDGLNGFWLSLGLCGLFFIPVIVLSLITSTCYMKQQNNTAAYFMDDPYSDYLMDDISKRNSSVSMKDSNYHSSCEDQV